MQIATVSPSVSPRAASARASRADRSSSCASVTVSPVEGASGAVLMTRMINHMRDRGLRYGLQTMCEGGGTANATLLELVAP
jgi:acetyl-CoA acyltransferase